MPQEQYNFGVGNLFAVRTDVLTPTPVRFGTVQGVTVDMTSTLKELYGQNQAPVAVAAGARKITGKVSAANISARVFNEIFFGEDLETGQMIAVTDEHGPMGIAIPASPPQLAVANAAQMSSLKPGVDLGVFNALTGIQMVRAAPDLTSPITPLAAGTYSFEPTTGTYSFSPTDQAAGVMVMFSYSYEQTSTGNRLTAFNKLMGQSPVFRMVLEGDYLGKKSNLTLYQCIATKLTLDYKNEDFTIPALEFSAFADDLGRYFDWSSVVG